MDISYPLGVFEQMTYAFQQEFGLYMVFAALLFGFILSFAVGANDSANSWGTPVGAGTVSLGVAFFLGSIMEMLGSVFLSAEVVSTVAGPKSVVNMALYKSDNETECAKYMEHGDTLLKEKTLVLGLVTSMVASQIWQLMATYLAWPVSGTHTIISALMGFTLVENGSQGINVGNPNLFDGSGVFKVIYGLFVSPIFTLGLSFAVYFLLYRFAVEAGKPAQLRSKLSYSACVFLIFLAITFTFVNMKKSEAPGGMSNKGFSFLMGSIVGLVFAVVFFFVILPYLSKVKGDLKVSFNICMKNKKNKPKEKSVEIECEDTCENSATLPIIEKDEFIDESDEVKRIFRPLQLLAACFGALTHGSNDVGNCIGPLVTVWYIYQVWNKYNNNNDR
jgi:phosphate/sulfate permease